MLIALKVAHCNESFRSFGNIKNIEYDHSKRNLGTTTTSKNSDKKFDRFIKTLRKLDQSKTVSAVVVNNTQKQGERVWSILLGISGPSLIGKTLSK